MNDSRKAFFPRVINTPVWLLISELCVANDASTYAVTLIGPSTSRFRDRPIVPIMYPIPLCSFDLSSSVGDWTLVVKKATRVRMSGLVLLLRYSYLATKEWNLFAPETESSGDSLTLNKFSSAGVDIGVDSPYSFTRSDIHPGFATVTTPGRWKFIIIPRYGCIFPLVTFTFLYFFIKKLLIDPLRPQRVRTHLVSRRHEKWLWLVFLCIPCWIRISHTGSLYIRQLRGLLIP